MKWLNNIFKTYIQWDFLTAFFVGMKYFLFKKRATINYPHEKGRLSPRFRGQGLIRHFRDYMEDRLNQTKKDMAAGI